MPGSVGAGQGKSSVENGGSRNVENQRIVNEADGVIEDVIHARL